MGDQVGYNAFQKGDITLDDKARMQEFQGWNEENF